MLRQEHRLKREGCKAPAGRGTHPLGRVDEEHNAIRDAKAGCHLVRKIHMAFKTTQKRAVRSTVSPGAAAVGLCRLLWLLVPREAE